VALTPTPFPASIEKLVRHFAILTWRGLG